MTGSATRAPARATASCSSRPNPGGCARPRWASARPPGSAAAALLARSQGEPAGAILTHSLITPAGVIALATGWLAATALLTALAGARSARLTDVLAVAAASALVAALVGRDRQRSGAGPAARAAVLPGRRGADVPRVRGWRCGPRSAWPGAARCSPASPWSTWPALRWLPALAIAFVAVAVGLGGFALAYASTLIRSAADQAADRVPLDALVSPGPDFSTPLELAPLPRWQALAAGAVLPVRRTEANYTSGGGTVTVPALGVPATGLTQIHGWRESDGSAPLTVLARRLAPAGPVRVPGPMLPAGTRWLSLRASPGPVEVTADLRDPQGAIRQVAFGTAGAGGAAAPSCRQAGGSLRLWSSTNPPGRPSPTATRTARTRAPPLSPRYAWRSGRCSRWPARGRSLLSVPLGAWRGVGAATTTPKAGAVATVDFAMSGAPGVLRPAQPTDTHPVPVLADPQTAASAGPGGRIALTVDGLPVTARVVGVLQRFPTLPADSAGFVVADEATLAAALDAQLPGQGRADELWIGTGHLAELRAALGSGALAQLDSTFRADIEHQLRDAPVARGVLGTLIAATALSAALAVVGLLAALLGGVRDDRVESDLAEQGVGPRGLRAELRLRLVLASLLGVVAGVGIAVLLTRLAVASVRAAGDVADPRPPVVTVVPWAALAAWSVGTFAVLALAGWLAPRTGWLAAAGWLAPRGSTPR